MRAFGSERGAGVPICARLVYERGMSSRERSFWGWGYADRFPNEEARRALGTQLKALLGFEPPMLASPPGIESIRLRKSRIHVPETLADFVRADDEARIRHAYGKAYCDLYRGFNGQYPTPPDWVAFPRSESEIVAILDWASDQRVAVRPFGGGTSVVGGVENRDDGDFRGAISLDLSKMNRVLEIDEHSHSARIQAGALGPELEAQLGVKGLTLRHYPQSFEFSTLGGWIATRAGGHFATLYTHIDDLVEATRMITPRGTLASRRLPGSGAGPSPDRMVLGSEGTLGILTEAWMRVRPRPVYRASFTAHFEALERAIEAVRALSQSGLYPSNCRLLDEREAAINFVAQGKLVLIVAFESADHPLEAKVHRAAELVRDHGGEVVSGPHLREGGAKGSASGEREDGAGIWKNAFIDAPYLQNILVSLGVVVDTFETAVTWDGFEALHEAVIRDVRAAMKEACGGGFISCRFTHVYPDGPAPYYTFIAPGKAGQELKQWETIKRAASDALLAHGATITHHHAVGRVHKPWYEHQAPKLFQEALRATKERFDPSGVLNPGILL